MPKETGFLQQKLKQLGLSDISSNERRQQYTFRVYFPRPPYKGALYRAAKINGLYNFVGLLLGQHGSTIQRIQRQSGARVELHDKDGNLNGDHPSPSDPTLHALILAETKDRLTKAVNLVMETLCPSNTEYESFKILSGGESILRPVIPEDWSEEEEEEEMEEFYQTATTPPMKDEGLAEPCMRTPNVWIKKGALFVDTPPSSSPMNDAPSTFNAYRSHLPPSPPAPMVLQGSAKSPGLFIATNYVTVPKRTDSVEPLGTPSPAQEMKSSHVNRLDSAEQCMSSESSGTTPKSRTAPHSSLWDESPFYAQLRQAAEGSLLLSPMAPTASANLVCDVVNDPFCSLHTGLCLGPSSGGIRMSSHNRSAQEDSEIDMQLLCSGLLQSLDLRNPQ